MFDFSNVSMESLVIHKVGNKLREEGYFTSNSLYDLRDGNLEELYMYVSQIFINKESFYEQSVNILKHLYEQSTHPQIKSGEFYMAYFSDCVVDDVHTDAIGIFKTENKERYLTVNQYANDMLLGCDTGINVKKLDKGCIIFNVESVDGYRVAIVDTVKKGKEEAQYWKDEFLRLANVQDEYFHTQNCLDVCQDFVENIYGQVYQADKSDRVMLMNDAIKYFDTNQEFQIDRFAEEVIKEPELIEQFKEHKQMYDYNQGFNPVENFSISNPAVKSAKRKLRNLIKLDTEIEIKIKNAAAEEDNANFIERGFDEEKGMKFYKVYFNEEE